MSRFTLRPPSSLTPLLTGCVYFAAASAALLVSRFEGGLAFIWGANAFLMAELMTSRKQHWPRALIACGVASAAATALFGMGPWAAIPMAFINLAESLIVALLCRRFVPDHRVVGSIRPLMVFILALCGCANVVAGLLAAGVASWLTPVTFAASFAQWYAGHILGALTFTPILILLLQGEFRRWVRDTSRRDKAEAALLIGLFVAVTVAVFLSPLPLLFLPLLPLMLIAFRIGQIGTAAAIILLAGIGGVATIAGLGPIGAAAGHTGGHVQFFQFFLSISFLLSVPVAAELNARRRLFRLLQESEARYRAITEHSGDVVLTVGIDGITRYASPAAREQIGCAPELLVGQPAVDLVDPEDRAPVIAAHRAAMLQPGSVHRVEFRPVARSSDAYEYCEMVTRALVDERGIPNGVVATVRDISRHKARQRALMQAAARDSLTGADSRRAFLHKLDRAIAQAAEGERSCLLLIDIDHFKAVNDQHGHGAGDRVLAGFVQRLAAGLDGGESIGRLGGEEFAILMRGYSLEDASRRCERLRALLREPIPTGGGVDIAITFSAGLAELHGAAERSTVLEAADAALYRAKRSGRNCVRLAA
ncbi:sensor domain-containing diguanylate cyclase [Sphingobium amiense]|uniref:Sensor domain-containing diguanylate cyclase n=1 Tax=Sphingobium amiense TaxID=135719 RepID=A0A494WDV4_9SPHN|nr:sensor domain-containing diguanylate cyclase [Sphingobium amiense]BBD99070.1 sensor domain-containing diguanylate cyclase [Sphingobium amiense]